MQQLMLQNQVTGLFPLTTKQSIGQQESLQHNSFPLAQSFNKQLLIAQVFYRRLMNSVHPNATGHTLMAIEFLKHTLW